MAMSGAGEITRCWRRSRGPRRRSSPAPDCTPGRTGLGRLRDDRAREASIALARRPGPVFASADSPRALAGSAASAETALERLMDSPPAPTCSHHGDAAPRKARALRGDRFPRRSICGSSDGIRW
jgi:hypothetical protein